MNCSTPGLPLHHQPPESTQTHVHRVSDAIQPSHPLSSTSPPALNLSHHLGLFKWVSSLHQVAKVLEFQLQHQSFHLRESFPRQVDKKSVGPQGERGLEFSRRKKRQTFFFPLHSLGLYNNNISFLRTVSGKNLLVNPVSLGVNYGSKSSEVFTTSRHSFDSL